MKERPILFLDIDGVLINHACYLPPLKQPGRGANAHPECVAELNRITDTTGSHIVVSSTWRLEGLMFCRETLRGWGVKAPVIDVTPRLLREKKGSSIVAPRGMEIAKWLEGYPRGVESFVILDDDRDMEPHLDRLVHTQTPIGLTREDADRAIQMLRVDVVQRAEEVR